MQDSGHGHWVEAGNGRVVIAILIAAPELTEPASCPVSR